MCFGFFFHHGLYVLPVQCTVVFALLLRVCGVSHDGVERKNDVVCNGKIYGNFFTEGEGWRNTGIAM